jgi:serine/threonine-protein kinase
MTQQTHRLNTALAGRYHIERQLGEGGMASVYLCEDLKHRRKVALKLLKPELAAVLGAERFVQEITTTASLQHPHILPLFDSGTADGFLFYVMPLVEGETLREKLNRETQLAVDEAVRIAREVLDALEYAHQHGIVHRDVKPENILLHGGHAMVADFGIALAVSAAAGGRMTETGLSLGTPHYMSPEQATAEKEITARSDVYSLGSVLYEMLTGSPPHVGSSAQQIIMKIITTPAEPVTVHRKSVPPNVAAAVAKSLEKLPADRFESAKAFADALGNSEFLTAHSTAARSQPAAVRVRAWQWTSAVLAAGLVISAVWGTTRKGSVSKKVVRLEFRSGAAMSVSWPSLTALPDGSGVLYCDGTDGRIRHWASLIPEPVAAITGGCRAVAFSPDGRYLVVTGAPTALTVISLAGDTPPRRLAVTQLDDMATYGGGVDWALDGNIYVASRTGVLRVSPTDGTSAVVARTDSQTTLLAIQVLPGMRFALVVAAPRLSQSVETQRIAILDLASGHIEPILQGTAVRFAAPDMLVMARTDGALVAVPFDPRTARPTGSAIRLDDSLSVTDSRATPALAVTPDGTLVYWKSDASTISHPVWVERDGTRRPLSPSWDADFRMVQLSPDGARIAAEVQTGSTSHVWLRELGTGQTTRLTMDGTINGRVSWAPDGRSVIVVSDRGGKPALYARRLDDGSIRPLPRYDPRAIFGSAWSRDGKWLALRTDDQAAGKADILAVRPGVDLVATPVVASPEFSEYAPAISPDGRWLAYVTNAGGNWDVWVTSFPSGKGRWQVTTSGSGAAPLWSPDGRELLFLSGTQMMSASISQGNEFNVLSQHPLFSTVPFRQSGFFFRTWDLSRDGKRFLMLEQSTEAVVRIVAVMNWRADLAVSSPRVRR